MSRLLQCRVRIFYHLPRYLARLIQGVVDLRLFDKSGLSGIEIPPDQNLFAVYVLFNKELTLHLFIVLGFQTRRGLDRL